MSTTETLIAPAGTWQLDPVHSQVGFEIAYLSGTFKGQFREFDGRLVVDGDEATLEGTAKVASVDVKDENLSAHLQSPDFFDTQRHPELRFESTAVEATADDIVVQGRLTIKGVTKPVELRGSYVGAGVDPYGNDRIGLELAGTVDRTEFGLKWNAPLPGGDFLLPNEVVLRANLAAVKAA